MSRLILLLASALLVSAFAEAPAVADADTVEPDPTATRSESEEPEAQDEAPVAPEEKTAEADEDEAGEDSGADEGGATKEGAGSETQAKGEALDAEEARAGPSSEGDGSGGHDASAHAKARKPWSLTVRHSYGWGLQIDDTTASSYGVLTASGSYALGHQVRASVNTGIRYTLDRTPNDAVRLDLGSITVAVNHGSLFKDESLTGLNLTGGLSVSQSLGLGTLTMGRGPVLGANLGLSRSFGGVSLSYSFNLNRFFYADAAPSSSRCVADRGSKSYCIGGYANAWSITNSLSANYSPIEDLSLSATLSLVNARSFAPSKPDAFSASYNPSINNRRESFGFSFSATWTTPVEGLSAGLSFSNARPWRTDGQTLALVDFSYGVGMLFDARFAAMSLDLSYSY